MFFLLDFPIVFVAGPDLCVILLFLSQKNTTMFSAPFCLLSLKEWTLEFCASAVMIMRLCVLGREDP